MFAPISFLPGNPVVKEQSDGVGMREIIATLH